MRSLVALLSGFAIACHHPEKRLKACSPRGDIRFASAAALCFDVSAIPICVRSGRFESRLADKCRQISPDINEERAPKQLKIGRHVVKQTMELILLS